MNAQRSQFEHLAVELIHLIFEYLAPHDLLFAFKKLNRRLTCILAQHPLCLPNNRCMSLELYLDYINSIILKHGSQIVYLHLSERYAPHAAHMFWRELDFGKISLPALKAVTIDDVPIGLFGVLLYDSGLLSNVHSLSLNVSYGSFHYFQYKELGVADFAIIVPILVELPKLRSLHVRMHTTYNQHYLLGLEQAGPKFVTHRNLHTLTMSQCSRELLVKLLDNGRLPKLFRLHVSFHAEHDPHNEELVHPTPLKQSYAPELRYVSVELHEGVGWMFTFLEEVQRHSQLDHLNIYGYMISGLIVSDVPRIAELRRWLLLSKSKNFIFRLNLEMRWLPECEESLDDFLLEYRRAIGGDLSSKSRTLTIHYPGIPLFGQVKMSETTAEEDESSDSNTSNNSSTSSNWVDDESVDENCEEMEVIEMDYMRDGLIESTRAVTRWHRLWKITLEGDFPDNNGVVGENIPHLLHVAQRSPYFRELHIKSDLDFGRVLSKNVKLGILLSSQLEVLCFTGDEANCSLLDLAKIIDTLFAHSKLSPCLKQLTFKVDAHPSSWLTVRHLVRGIGKMLDRFPELIRFNLHCQYASAFQERKYNLSELAPKWSILSAIQRPWMNRSYEYRHKPHMLEIWL